VESTDIGVSKIDEIKNMIKSLAIMSDISIAESVFVIERAFEQVLFDEFIVQFDDDFYLTATNREHIYILKSMDDVKRLRHQAFVKITETRKKFVEGLKSNVSLKEIAALIAKETNKLAAQNSYMQFNYLMSKHVKGFILSKIEGGYIVNIGINKIAYFYTEDNYEVYKEHIFFVNNVKKDTDTGVIKILLEIPKKPDKKVINIFEMFKNKTGKITKNGVSLRVTNEFVWVFEPLHRETFFKEIYKSENEKLLALLKAKNVFDRYAFRQKTEQKSRAEGTA
jgi:hypothetical protein